VNGRAGSFAAVRDDRERLLDIREAIERIDRYASRGWDEFASNELN